MRQSRPEEPGEEEDDSIAPHSGELNTEFSAGSNGDISLIRYLYHPNEIGSKEQQSHIRRIANISET
jgi:hypothetical protein